MAGTALITEVVGYRGKTSGVCALCLALLKFSLNEVGNEFFGLNSGELDTSLDLAIHKHLLLEEVGERGEQGVSPWAEKLLDLIFVCKSSQQRFLLIHGLCSAKKLVDLNDKVVEGTNVGEKALRDQNAAIVLASFGTTADQVTDVVNDIFETLMTILALLRHNDKVRRGLQGALDRYMRWALAHEADEVPVLDCTSTIRKHVTDQLGVHLRGSIKADG